MLARHLRNGHVAFIPVGDVVVLVTVESVSFTSERDDAWITGSVEVIGPLKSVTAPGGFTAGGVHVPEHTPVILHEEEDDLPSTALSGILIPDPDTPA